MRIDVAHDFFLTNPILFTNAYFSPCLVEMNCRAHGGDGNWRPLCKAMTGGYDQVSASVDAYVDEHAFAALPEKPPSPLLAFGQCVDLVSYTEGIVKSSPGYDLIRSLPSFVCLETHIKPGVQVKRTVDMLTDAGSLVVLHSDEKVLAEDIAIIRHIEETNAMFEFCTKEEAEWMKKRERMVRKPFSLDFKFASQRPSRILFRRMLETCFEEEDEEADWLKKREQLLLKPSSLYVKMASQLPSDWMYYESV